MNSLTRYECTRLRFYVYLYRDPKTDEVFYVGRGKGGRLFSHLSATGRSRKARYLRRLYRSDLEPRIDILAHGLPSSTDAAKIETAAIDLLGLRHLTNVIKGQDSSRYGLVSLDAIRSRIQTEKAKILHPVIIFVVNNTYEDGASAASLYHATRQFWRVKKEYRDRAVYALAVFHGLIIQIYKISKWHPAGTTKSPRKYRGPDVRWEFTAKIASPQIRAHYQFKGYDVPQGLIGGCQFLERGR